MSGKPPSFLTLRFIFDIKVFFDIFPGSEPSFLTFVTFFRHLRLPQRGGGSPPPVQSYFSDCSCVENAFGPSECVTVNVGKHLRDRKLKGTMFLLWTSSAVS